MITRIGIVAGEIWQLLESDEYLSLEGMAAKLDRPEYLILMSVGWLAREGHILLEQEGDEFRVSLRGKNEVGEIRT